MQSSHLAVLVAVGVSVLSIASAWAETPQTPALPAALDPGALKPFLAASAKGVQIYTCGKNDGGTWAWAFKAPEAQLFATDGAAMGRHYAGPTWEDLGGARIVGAKKASADAPDGKGIPWLLLDVKAREGTGALAQAAGVLRVATEGGKDPSGGCDESHAGAEQRVPYKATYFFLK
jgi:hypothetical protein